MAVQRCAEAMITPDRSRRFAKWRALPCAAGLILLLWSACAAWPQAVVRIVVPAPPGGAGDIVARMLAEQVGRNAGPSIIIDNRPGAGTIIGTEAVARAAPNGGTLLLTAPYLIITPQMRKLSFDPLTAFAPVCQLVSSPGVIAVNSAAPFGTLTEFLNAARAQPGDLTIAAAGPGTVHHIGIEMLKRAADVNLTFVPYAGGAAAITAVLGGHVTAVFAEYAPLADHIKAGRLRPIAAATRKRIDNLPDVPAVAETYPSYAVDFWWGLFAPARTPTATVARVADWSIAAFRERPVRTKLAGLGFEPAARCGAEFAALLREEYDRYGQIIRAMTLKTE
jgi:tripartite-type tricarboxylate transporter receptor subunit TctC